MKEFTREELQRIASKAERLAIGENSKERLQTRGNYWTRAYERLADAAWTLDAIMARTEDK
ncbi:unnamed protein product [marine sediment metagenome]|uniref:Uncharacterized protein n=1 Tax=marine sediment metagenome TaxID=412755 RepID=X1GZH3_9ZZZZ